MSLVLENHTDKAIQESISYSEYETLVSNLVSEGKSSSPEHLDALVEYTKLNERRMKRWTKTFKFGDGAKEKIQAFNKKVTWLVITESWCGDAAHTMPIIDKIASESSNINFKVVLRDQQLPLMDQHLTNGGRSIPKLIMIDDETGDVLNTWGPRPSEATKLVEDYKEEHGKLTPEFKQELQVWYNKNKGQNTQDDLLELLSLK